jgi:CHAT domain-containing protein
MSRKPCSASTRQAGRVPTKSVSGSSRQEWRGEEVRLRLLAPGALNTQGDATSAAAQLVGGPLDCGTVQPGDADRERAALLSGLDSTRATVPPDSSGEAQLLLRMAATYEVESVAIPIELLRSALDLAIDGTKASPAVAGLVLACLTNDLAEAGRSKDAAALTRDTDERMRRQFRGTGFDSYRAALLKSSTNASLIPAEPPTPDSVAIEISELSKSEGFAFPSKLVAALIDIRRLEIPRTSSDGKNSLDVINGIATDRDGPTGPLRGLVLAVQAERELVGGTVQRVLSYIDEFSPSENDRRWLDLEGDALELKDLRDQLETFAATERTARHDLEPKVAELHQLESQSDTNQRELTTELVNIISVAAGANQFGEALDAFQRLMSLHPGFGDPGRLERSHPEELLDGLVTKCYDSADIELSPAGEKVPIAECARAAITAAGLVAEDAFDPNSCRGSESRMGKDQSVAFGQVFSNIEPLLHEGLFYSQADLESLLKWSIASRPTHASAAAERRLLSAVDRNDAGVETALQTWHAALSAWMRSEANAECAELTTPAPKDLERLRAIKDTDTATAEDAWKKLAERAPDGKPVPVNSELGVANLEHSLARGEAIAAYTTTNDAIVIWLIRADGLNLRIVPKADLESNINLSVGEISDETQTSTDLELRPFEHLYATLIAPIRAELDGITTLYIEPDLETARVPFVALLQTSSASPNWRISSNWTPQWLVRQFAISFIPSLPSFATDHLRPSRTPRYLLAAGDPKVESPGPQRPASACERILTSTSAAQAAPVGLAPGADEELAKAMSIAGPKGHLLSQDDFTLQKLITQYFSDFGLLVFATHGMRESASEPARLLLSSDPTDAASSSWLTPEDVGDLPLNADLVILSACDSGLAEGREGLSSLIPAFLYAGSRQVVATAWHTNAATAQAITLPLVHIYMTTGSRHLDVAVQTALVDMITSRTEPALRHPYYWASVFLLGASTN